MNSTNPFISTMCILRRTDPIDFESLGDRDGPGLGVVAIDAIILECKLLGYFPTLCYDGHQKQWCGCL